MTDNSTWLLQSDGASLGNPGPAGAGAVLYNPHGELVAEVSDYLGTATNNEAEYAGLIHGLKAAHQHGADSLLVKMDSELIARQINGIYKVKNERLRPMFAEAMELLNQFKAYKVTHVRREFNAAADALASKAAKKRLSS